MRLPTARPFTSEFYSEFPRACDPFTPSDPGLTMEGTEDTGDSRRADLVLATHGTCAATCSSAVSPVTPVQGLPRTTTVPAAWENSASWVQKVAASACAPAAAL